MNIETLSDVPLYAGRPSRRTAPKRKAASWIIVGIVHLLMLNLLMFSQNWTALVRRGVEHETILDLSGSRPDNSPSEKIIVPRAPLGTPPAAPVVPIPVPPPPVPEPAQPAQREGSPRGDLLGAVGRDLACRAGNYENLSDAQRSRCPRAPWQGVELPNGAIVMARPPATNPFAPPPPEFRISGADANRLKVERADPCPVMLNVPCLNRIPGRD